MAAQLSVDADLEFTLAIPGSPPVTGSLTGSGTALELQVSTPGVFSGRSDSGAVRGFARTLAERGITVQVVSPTGPMVTLGVGRTSWLQRRLTGSRHIRVEGGAGLWSLVRSRRHTGGGEALPDGRLAPSATLLPLVPTLRRRPRRPVTTTHDPERGGNPRLSLPLGVHAGRGERPRVFPLKDDVTTVGSAPDNDISLPDLESRHAEIRHDDRDEFVVVRMSDSADTRVHGAPVAAAILRTGTRVDFGPWTLTYFRAEYADHGRPYGGRVGGELGHQQPQPSREQLQGEVEEL